MLNKSKTLISFLSLCSKPPKQTLKICFGGDATNITTTSLAAFTATTLATSSLGLFLLHSDSFKKAC